MKMFTSLIAITILLTGCSPTDQSATESSEAAANSAADTVYTNGRIYTVNEAQPWADAIAIKDGAFLVVGSNEDVEAVRGSDTAVIDLQGQLVLPGLIDVHMHASGAAMGRANLYLQNKDDPQAMLAEIEAYAEENPDLPFIRGES